MATYVFVRYQDEFPLTQIFHRYQDFLPLAPTGPGKPLVSTSAGYLRTASGVLRPSTP